VAAAIVPLEAAVAVVAVAAAVMPEALGRGRGAQQRRGHRRQWSRRGHGGRAAAVAPG
jgi:hypothetical protein